MHLPDSPPVEELWSPHWYVVARAETLRKGRPLGIVRLGRRLVLWRDRAGQAHCADSACPHRGVDLSLGRVEGGELECRYHGFRYGADGACTATPCEGPDAKPSHALCLRLHPLREEHGYLWAFLGGPVPARLPPLPWLPDAPDPGPCAASVDHVWNARFSRVMEGMMDLHHFPFAHRRYSPKGYTRLEPYEVEADDHAVRTRGWLRKPSAPSGTGFSFEIDVAYPGIIYLRFSPRLHASVVCTPVDTEHTFISARFRQDYLRIPWLGWLFARFLLALEYTFVQPDDYRMVRFCFPRSGTLDHERLVRADRGIVAWHRLHQRALGAEGDRAAS